MGDKNLYFRPDVAYGAVSEDFIPIDLGLSRVEKHRGKTEFSSPLLPSHGQVVAPFGSASAEYCLTRLYLE